MSDDWTVSMDDIDLAKVTDITFGTKAQYVYELYRTKRKMLADLQYECDLLMEQYHAEMRKSHIPFVLLEIHLTGMFAKDRKSRRYRDAAREIFLKEGFSKPFLDKHKVEFVDYRFHGYGHTAISIVLVIGDYEYVMEFPQPQNILKKEDKESLVGEVKFRVDRIHKSHKDDFIKGMEPVMMPTYDWKECFKAIEQKVEGEK